MRKYILLCLLVLNLVCTGGLGWAQTIDLSKPFDISRMSPAIVGSGGAAAAEGYTKAQSCEGSASSTDYQTANYYICSRFQASDAGPITKVELYLKNTGTLTGTAKLRIVTDNSGVPTSTVVTGGTNSGNSSPARASLTSSYQWTAYTGFSATLTVGNYYWLCEGDGAYYDTEFNYQVDTSCNLGLYKGDDWPPSTNTYGNRGMRYILYKGTP